MHTSGLETIIFLLIVVFQHATGHTGKWPQIIPYCWSKITMIVWQNNVESHELTITECSASDDSISGNADPLSRLRDRGCYERSYSDSKVNG